MKKLLAVLFSATMLSLAWVACNSNGPTTPEPVTSNDYSKAPTAAATPTTGTPTTVAPVAPTGPGYAINFYPNAGWELTNQSGIGQAYRAYITNFDNQSVEVAFNESGTIANGDTFQGSFNRGCVQLDLTQDGPAGRPLAGGNAYFDKDGKQYNPSNNPEKTTECRTTPCVEKWIIEEEAEYGEWSACQPSETPGVAQSCSKHRTVTYYENNSCTKERRVARTGTETLPCECPCVGQWIEQTFVRENETPYGECQPGALTASTHSEPPTIDCPGHRSRTVDIVVYETHSCSQEKREKSRVTVEEQAPCTAQCEQAFCHTENFKISKDFRWQCQNVPPGTPGHWPGHFDWPHGDFFGPCTTNKCYSITN